MPLEPLLVRALTDCGFCWMPGTIAADNVESFLHLARTKGAERTLEEFLREIESLEKALNLESDLADRDQGNVVQVMTAHAAKGLEFPVTIIAAMDKGTQRNSAPITFTPDFGLGIKWRSDRDKGIGDSWHIRNAARFEEREKHEEHRLLYVAMTRAEEHLILSYSRGKRAPQNWAKIVDQLEASEDISILETADEPPALRADADAATAAEIPVIARPAITAQHDTAVNVTSLAVFANCPRKYYLQRYAGWNTRRASQFDPVEDLPEDDDLDISAADLGSAVHEILAARLVSKPGDYPAEAHRLANVFLESNLGARAAASPRAAREWDFIIDIDGTLVRGTVDLWFEDNGEIHVVDYKTDAHVNAEAYTPQLALYALAIERALGKRPAHAWLHFLRADTLVEVPLDHDVTPLLARLREAQDQLRFDLREGDHCRTCQFYRSLCPAGH
jgi:ATP-dependent exoDNAse (exonuclease V) beta subunit